GSWSCLPPLAYPGGPLLCTRGGSARGRILYDGPMRVFGAAGALVFALLAGCVSFPQSDALRARPPDGLPTRAELAQVPFHAQDDFLCGPASLAMLFGAAGVSA